MSATSGGEGHSDGYNSSGLRFSGGVSGSAHESSETGESSRSTMSITDSPSTSFQTNHEANVTKINLEAESVSGAIQVDMTGSNVNLTLDDRQTAEGVVNMGFDQDEGANRVEAEFKSINGELKADKVSEAVNLELVNMVPYGNGNSANYGIPINGIPVKKDSEGTDMSSPYDEYFVPVNEHKKYMRGEKLYVTKDKRRPTSWRKCLSWIVACAVITAILIVAILAGTGVILSQDSNEIKKVSVGRNLGDTKPLVTDGLSDSQEKSALGEWFSHTDNRTHMHVPRSIEFALPIDNIDWNSAYLNNNSTEYQDLLNATVNQLESILIDKSDLDLKMIDFGFNIINISRDPFQALYRMGWNSEQEANNPNVPFTLEKFKNKLIDSLNSNGGYIDKYHIDMEGIHVNYVANLCLNNNGGCSHICFYNYLNQQFSCTCPTNMKLDGTLRNCVKVSETSDNDYASIPSINYPENHFESSEIENNGHFSHDYDHKSDSEYDYDHSAHYHLSSSNDTQADSKSNFDENVNKNYNFSYGSNPKLITESVSDSDTDNHNKYESSHDISMNSGPSSLDNLDQNERSQADINSKSKTSTQLPAHDTEYSSIDLTGLHDHFNENKNEFASTTEPESEYHHHHNSDDHQLKVSELSHLNHYPSTEPTSDTPSLFSINLDSNAGSSSLNFSASTLPTSNEDYSIERHQHYSNFGNDSIMHSANQNVKNASTLNEFDKSNLEHKTLDSRPGTSESDHHHVVPLLEEILLQNSSPNSTESQNNLKVEAPGQTLLSDTYINAKGEPVIEEIVIDKSSPQGIKPNETNADNVLTSNYRETYPNQNPAIEKSLNEEGTLNKNLLGSKNHSEKENNSKIHNIMGSDMNESADKSYYLNMGDHNDHSDLGDHKDLGDNRNISILSDHNDHRNIGDHESHGGHSPLGDHRNIGDHESHGGHSPLGDEKNLTNLRDIGDHGSNGGHSDFDDQKDLTNHRNLGDNRNISILSDHNDHRNLGDHGSHGGNSHLGDQRDLGDHESHSDHSPLGDHESRGGHSPLGDQRDLGDHESHSDHSPLGDHESRGGHSPLGDHESRGGHSPLGDQRDLGDHETHGGHSPLGDQRDLGDHETHGGHSPLGDQRDLGDHESHSDHSPLGDHESRGGHSPLGDQRDLGEHETHGGHSPLGDQRDLGDHESHSDHSPLGGEKNLTDHRDLGDQRGLGDQKDLTNHRGLGHNSNISILSDHIDHSDFGDHGSHGDHRDLGDQRGLGDQKDLTNHRDLGNNRNISILSDQNDYRDLGDHGSHGDHRDLGDHGSHGDHRDLGDNRNISVLSHENDYRDLGDLGSHHDLSDHKDHMHHTTVFKNEPKISDFMENTFTNYDDQVINQDKLNAEEDSSTSSNPNLDKKNFQQESDFTTPANNFFQGSTVAFDLDSMRETDSPNDIKNKSVKVSIPTQERLNTDNITINSEGRIPAPVDFLAKESESNNVKNTSVTVVSKDNYEMKSEPADSSKYINELFDVNTNKSSDDKPSELTNHVSNNNESRTPESLESASVSYEKENEHFNKPLSPVQKMANMNSSNVKSKSSSASEWENKQLDTTQWKYNSSEFDKMKTVEQEIGKSEPSVTENDQLFTREMENKQISTDIPESATYSMDHKNVVKLEKNHLLIHGIEKEPNDVTEKKLSHFPVVKDGEHETVTEIENNSSSFQKTKAGNHIAAEVETTTMPFHADVSSEGFTTEELNKQRSSLPSSTESFLASQESYDPHTQQIIMEITNADDLSNNIKDEAVDDEFNTLLEKNYNKNDFTNDTKEAFNKYSNKQTFLKGDKKKLKELGRLDRSELDKKTTKLYNIEKDFISQKHTTEYSFNSDYGYHIEQTTPGVKETTSSNEGLSADISVLPFNIHKVENPELSTLRTISTGFEVYNDKSISDSDGENYKDDTFDSKEDYKSEKDFTKLDKDHKYEKPKSGKKKDLKKKGSFKDGKNVELDDSKKYHMEITGEKNEFSDHDLNKENLKDFLSIPVTAMTDKIKKGEEGNENDSKIATPLSKEQSSNSDSNHPIRDYPSQSQNVNFDLGHEVTTRFFSNPKQQSDSSDSTEKPMQESDSRGREPALLVDSTDKVPTLEDVPRFLDAIKENTTTEGIEIMKQHEVRIPSLNKFDSEKAALDTPMEANFNKGTNVFEKSSDENSKGFHTENISKAENDQYVHSLEPIVLRKSNNESLPHISKDGVEISEVHLKNNFTAPLPDSVTHNESEKSSEDISLYEISNSADKHQPKSENSNPEFIEPHPVTVFNGTTLEAFDRNKNVSVDQKLIGENEKHSSFGVEPVSSVSIVNVTKSNTDSLTNGEDSSVYSITNSLSGRQGGHEVRLQNSSAFTFQGGNTPIRRVLNHTTYFERPYTIQNQAFLFPNGTTIKQFNERKDLNNDKKEIIISKPPILTSSASSNGSSWNLTHFTLENGSFPGTVFYGYVNPEEAYQHALTNSSGGFVRLNSQPSFTIKGQSGDFGRSAIYILGNNSKSSVNSTIPVRTHHVIFRNSTVFALQNLTDGGASRPIGIQQTLIDSGSVGAKKSYQSGQNLSASNIFNKVGYNFGFISKCAAGQFQCLNGTSKRGSACIDLSSKCDSINDCSDGSDEVGCVENNCPGNFQCSDGTCLKRHLVCNGIIECTDGSDEKQCERWKCEFDEFKCPSGRCIPVLWQCDGKADCVNHTDEQNCQRSCGNDEYLCPEGWCVPLTYRCNGVKDCSNGEDEQLCDCSLDEFKCQSGGCVLQNQICNGVDDCLDRSDEWNCIQLQQDSKLLQIRTPMGEYEPVCSDNWSPSFSDKVCASLGYSSSVSLGEDALSVPFSSNKSFYILKKNITVKENDNILANLLMVNNTCSSNKWVQIACQEFSCGSRSMTDNSYVEGRLVGGIGANAGQWPSVALLYNVRNMHSCTANILTPRWVLASYNCLKFGNKNFNQKDWKLFGGSTVFDNKKENGETRNIAAVVSHPQMKFNQFLFSNDLALVKLDEALPFSNALGAVCLPEQEIHSRLICVTAGWGMNGVGDEGLKQQLQYLPVPTMNLTDCNSTEHYSGFITDDKICAGYNTMEKSLCYNEEGAPLMCINDRGEWELQGMLSYHSDCGRGSHPSIFNSIQPVKEWIKQTIGISVDRNIYENQR